MMYTIRFATLRDVKQIEEIIFLSGGCSRRDWIRQDEPIDQLRAKTEYVRLFCGYEISSD